MKFLLLLSLILPAVSLANITARQEHLINKGASNASVQLGTLLNKTKNLVRVTWDYAVDGGAVGDITPRKGATIPDNAIITRSWIETLTTVDSEVDPDVTLAIKTENAADVLAAVDVDSLTAGSLREGVSTGATSLMKKMSADRAVKFTVAIASLNQGKVDAYIEYVLGN